MGESMVLRLWGVRGSTPTPVRENLKYGGNTSCVELRAGGELFVFDCGTGLRLLGNSLQREFGRRQIRAQVFLSHYHWDHIQGIPRRFTTGKTRSFFIPFDLQKSTYSAHSSTR